EQSNAEEDKSQREHHLLRQIPQSQSEPKKREVSPSRGASPHAQQKTRRQIHKCRDKHVRRGLTQTDYKNRRPQKYRISHPHPYGFTDNRLSRFRGLILLDAVMEPNQFAQKELKATQCKQKNHEHDQMHSRILPIWRRLQGVHDQPQYPGIQGGPVSVYCHLPVDPKIGISHVEVGVCVVVDDVAIFPRQECPNEYRRGPHNYFESPMQLVFQPPFTHWDLLLNISDVSTVLICFTARSRSRL